MTIIKNLTPHTLSIKDADGKTIEITPSGVIARVSSQSVKTEEILGIPVYQTVYGEVTGLPAEEEEVYLVVSSLVAARCQGRKDILVPGAPIRDEKGVIIGANGLQRI